MVCLFWMVFGASERAVRGGSEGLAALDLLAVEELKLSYHNPEAIFFIVYT